MIIGIGNDIIEIERIKGVIERHGQRFLDRLFTKKEQIYCQKAKEPYRHYAGRFAAKEAIAKAIGTGFGPDLSWTEIEILNDPSGKPTARVKNNKSQGHVLISISHCKHYATAFCIIEE